MMKKIKQLWAELNQSIYVGDRLKRNLHVLTLVSFATAALGIILIILDVMSQKWGMLAAAAATFLGGAGCAYLAGIRKNREAAALIPTIFCAVAFTVYTVTGLGDGTSIFWILLMPIGIGYFVGVKHEIILSGYYSILFVVLFYTPIRHSMAAYYSDIFMSRFPLIFIGLTVFTLIAMVQYHRMALRDIAYTERLNSEVEKQTSIAKERAERLEKVNEEVEEMLALTIDAKDRYTNGHSFRVAAYSEAFARRLGMPEEECRNIRQEAMLHDVGKIGVPDEVLNKPGRLTDEEFGRIKSHTRIGGSILKQSSVMQGAADVAKYHHERYDGSGYPDGKKGEEIPLHARIVSIADAYDAMRSDRIYRKGLDPETIHKELIRCRGTQFDPAMMDAFLEMAGSGELDAITEKANAHLAQAIELGLIGQENA